MYSFIIIVYKLENVTKNDNSSALALGLAEPDPVAGRNDTEDL
jgi:hypothetical protein